MEISKEDFEKHIRSVKINDTFSNTIKVDTERYKEFKNTQEYEIYKKYYDGKAITGSIVLNLFGLIDRSVKDIDIIDDGIYCFNYNHVDHYSIKPNIAYRGSICHTMNTWFSMSEFYVDVFHDNNKPKIKYKDLVLDQPLEILKMKYELIESNPKHLDDIRKVFYEMSVDLI